MNRKKRMFLSVVMFLSIVSSTAVVQVKSENVYVPTVLLDQQTMEFKDVPSPYIIQGSTLVPMKKIFEALGAKIIHWDNETKTVTATKNQTEIKYTIGETEAWINGHKVTFASIPGTIKEGTTFVPLRFISELLGATVGYDGNSRTVTIDSNTRVWGPQDAVEEYTRYRLSLPYQTILEDAPYFISFIEENSDANSYIYFGDSVTWGSYMGRSEVFTHLIQESSDVTSYNLGVPGFTSGQLVPYIKYALQNLTEPKVVIQLQYFWGSTKEFTGFNELLATTIPDYSTSLDYVRKDMSADEDVVRPAYADYTMKTEEDLKQRIDELRQLFVPYDQLNEELKEDLLELKKFTASRPTQQFYIYIPPYLLSEIFQYTEMENADFTHFANQVREIFSDVPNVHFTDFNQVQEDWSESDYIDWIHRSAEGEVKFAKQMKKWLMN